MRLCLLMIGFVLISACAQGEKSGASKVIKAITEEEAIELAEKYIYEKGYTDKIPPTLTFENANLGTDEFATSLDGVIQLRRNTLEPKALEARMYKKETLWAVGFEYVNKEDNIGRCVSMDTLGRNIKVLEGQLELSWLYRDQQKPVGEWEYRLD